ncbi:MAG TPA: hypothetical protein ENJ95_14120 [Bacteroidetes bacterium]|nr:hypothetical protein [Bacteroidota bacterium]
MKKIIFSICLFALPFLLPAQYLTGIAAYYDDSFAEWRFFTGAEDEEGELNLRWDDDWTDWDYRIGEIFGNIKMKWKDRPGEWELRGNNQIVTARALWRNDFSEWRITDNNTTFTLKAKWKNQTDNWSAGNSKHGTFEMETNRERDPRDWNIYDDLDGEVSFELKMMMVFIVVYHSTPKQ